MKFNKDGKTYYFNSKRFKELNNLFGITEEKKKTVDTNLEFQKNI